MMLPGKQVFIRMKDGDEAAFMQLRSHYQIPAFQFCLNILKDEQDAEMIMQDVFQKVWAERLALESSEAFQTYLFIHLKKGIFGRMKKYEDPDARRDFLNKMTHT